MKYKLKQGSPDQKKPSVQELVLGLNALFKLAEKTGRLPSVQMGSEL